MAGLIEIRTEEGVFDLLQGAEENFYITGQIHDINNLQSRNSSYSKTLQLPPTENNLNLLNIESVSYSGINRTINVSFSLNGVQIDPYAKMLVTGITQQGGVTGIDAFVVFGNFDFFNQISAGRIDELNWADLAIEWDAFVLRVASRNTTDLVYPICDWADRQSEKAFGTTDFAYFQDCNSTGFFLYVKEVMRRIAAKAGFSIVFAEDIDPELDILALACPVEKFIDTSDPTTSAYNNVVRKTGDQTVEGITERLTFQDKSQDYQNKYNLTTQQWENIPTGTYTFEITGTYDFDKVRQLNLPSRLDIYRNLTLIDSFVFDTPEEGVDVPFFIFTDISVLSGDVVYAEIVAADGPGVGTDSILTIKDNTTFRFYSPGANQSRIVQPSQHIPQMNSSEFFRSILNIYNLVVDVDPVIKTVSIRRFESVYENAENNISNLLTFSEPVKIRPTIDCLAQNTRFEWQEDNLLRRDASTNLTFPNSVNDSQNTALSLPFSACDNSVQLFLEGQNTFLKAKVPMLTNEQDWHIGSGINIRLVLTGQNEGVFYFEEGVGGPLVDLDCNIGDIIWIKSPTYPRPCRVVSYNAGTGRIQTPIHPTFSENSDLIRISRLSANSFTPRLALMLQGEATSFGIANGTTGDGTVAVLGADSHSAHWLDSLTMAEITKRHYAKTLESLSTPLVVNVWAKLEVPDVVKADFLRPIYIEEFGAYFYLNKIEQFKVGRLTRLELVRLSSYNQ